MSLSTSEKLKLALNYIKDTKDNAIYDDSSDYIGHRPCCGVTSYKPHSLNCELIKLIKLLETNENI